MNVAAGVVVPDGQIRSKLLKESRMLATEVRIVRALSHSDPGQRMAQVRKLPRCFAVRGRSQFPHNEADLKRIWKGLLYTLWMADKPQVEEELAGQLAEMVGGFGGNTNCSLAYFSAFMLAMSEEFFGIDLWSIDKFPMLVRRMLRSILCLFKHCQWPVQLLNNFNLSMLQSVLAEWPKSRRLTMHYMSIFFEELAMVADGEITAYKVNMFLRPFLTYMATQHDDQLVAHCRTEVLDRLLYQSDLGRRETLDPGAGNGKLLPVLPFNAECVLDALSVLTITSANSKRHEVFRELTQIFETYQGGVFPLDVPSGEGPKPTEKAKLVGPNPKKKLPTKVHKELQQETAAPMSESKAEPVGVSNQKKKTSQKSAPRKNEERKIVDPPSKNPKVRLLQRKRKRIMLEKKQKKVKEDPGTDTEIPKLRKEGKML